MPRPPALSRLGDRVDASTTPALDASPRARADACAACGSSSSSCSCAERGLEGVALPFGARPCGWCEGPIPPSARRDSIYCGVRCRQRAHKFHRGASMRAATSRPMRFAYGDPPYPGKAELYRGHRDYAGEVDHRELVERLGDEFPDGWALSTSADALQSVLAVCPPTVRVAAWLRGERPTDAYRPLSSWEPVIVDGGRAYLTKAADRRLDSLVAAARARRGDPRRVVGAKPARFAWWLFDLLGALPGDELVDLFPGSGGIARAWRFYSSTTSAAGDASRVATVDVSA